MDGWRLMDGQGCSQKTKKDTARPAASLWRAGSYIFLCFKDDTSHLGLDFPVNMWRRRTHPEVTKVLLTQQLSCLYGDLQQVLQSLLCDSARHSHLASFSRNLFLAFCHCYHLHNYSLTFIQPYTAYIVIYLTTSPFSGQLPQHAALICQTLQSRSLCQTSFWLNPLTCRRCRLEFLNMPPQQSLILSFQAHLSSLYDQLLGKHLFHIGPSV